MFVLLKRLRMSLILLASVSLLSGGLALAKKPTPEPEPTISYTVEPLGMLDGMTDSVARGLNDAGDVVGDSGPEAFVSYCVGDARQMRNVNDFLVGREEAEWWVRIAYDVNNRDGDQVQVVGYAQKYEVEEIDGEWYRGDQVDDYYHAVRVTLDLSSFESEGILDDLGFTGIAKGVNDYGDVVGTAYPGGIACIYTDTTGMCTLPLFGEAFYSDGFAINNSMQATGNSDLEQGWLYRAWRYSPLEGMLDLGGIKARPAIGIESQGKGINDSGDVVGWSTAGKKYHGFLYTDETGIVDLGDLGGGFSDATDINNDGIVTGVSRIADDSMHLFVYDSQVGMVRVEFSDSLVTWDNDQPRINSSGQICCSPRSLNDDLEACLLTPVPAE